MTELQKPRSVQLWTLCGFHSQIRKESYFLEDSKKMKAADNPEPITAVTNARAKEVQQKEKMHQTKQ